MTKDLEAINLLSERFSDNADKLTRLDSGEAAFIPNGDPILREAQRVLDLYEQELLKAPDDEDVKKGLSNHLYRIGFMHYDALSPKYLLSTDYSLMDMRNRSQHHAYLACRSLVQSYELAPNCSAALTLADIFRLSQFYGTALYWLKEGETIAEVEDFSDVLTKAKAQRFELQADGKTTDPPLSTVWWPTKSTSGLRLDFQPADVPAVEATDLSNKAQTPSDTSKANSKSGCFVATTCYGSYNHPDVMIFRNWRDNTLLQNPSGRAFVAFYYRFSPPLADSIARKPVVASWIRKRILEPMARKLQ